MAQHHDSKAAQNNKLLFLCLCLILDNNHPEQKDNSISVRITCLRLLVCKILSNGERFFGLKCVPLSPVEWPSIHTSGKTTRVGGTSYPLSTPGGCSCKVTCCVSTMLS